MNLNFFRRSKARELQGQNEILREELRQYSNDTELLQERMAELELALEDANWMRLMLEGEQEFSRAGLRKINDLARMMFVKNPLIRRGVLVKALYVWAQGVTVRAKQPEINEVIQKFWDDPKNRAELTSHQARMYKEYDLEVEGNLFFVFFTRPTDGRVRIRTIQVEEISEIVSDPEDAKTPRYYLRNWTEKRIDPASGRTKTSKMKAYYPDFRYKPKTKPDKFGNVKVMWNSPVYHVRVGGMSGWKFGVSEVYASIDWARAYKEFLEDWASLTRSFTRFAWRMTTRGGKKGLAAARAKMATSLASGGGTGAESNPPPTTGAMAFLGEGYDLQPFQLRGANISAEDGRRLLLMVAAGLGFPETYFGDVSVGTLATAKTMDRPTELAMRERQMLWTDVLREIVEYVQLQSVKANSGKLHSLGKIAREVDNDGIEERIEWNEGVNAYLDIDFPPILAKDMQAAVQAVVTALTLNGQQLALLDEPIATRLILKALAEDDVDEIMKDLFPEDAGSTPSEARVVEAARALVESILAQKMTGGGDGQDG